MDHKLLSAFCRPDTGTLIIFCPQCPPTRLSNKPCWRICVSVKPPEIKPFSVEIKPFSGATGFKVHLAESSEQGIESGDLWEFLGMSASLQELADFFFSGKRLLYPGLPPLYTCFRRCKG